MSAVPLLRVGEKGRQKVPFSQATKAGSAYTLGARGLEEESQLRGGYLLSHVGLSSRRRYRLFKLLYRERQKGAERKGRG